VVEAFRRSARPSREERRRSAYFGPRHGARETRILARADLLHGPLEGPLIVEEFDTTVVVPPGWRAALDEFASIVLEPNPEASRP
jgi:N-methylhydantoinase A